MHKTAVISGVGSGFGASLVRTFAQAEYQVGMFARSPGYIEELATELQQEGLTSLPVPTDITDPEQVVEGFQQIRDEFGPVDVLINHAGNAAWGEFSELTAEGFEQSWRVCAQGAFLCSQEAVVDMEASGSGAILFTGATSSIRGRAGAIAFSSAKFAVRGFAWALARELWPKGIHVAHTIIDGVIDTPALRAGGDLEEDEPLLDPDAMAESYLSLVNQAPGAWTFEIELRPHNEAFFE